MNFRTAALISLVLAWLAVPFSGCSDSGGVVDAGDAGDASDAQDGGLDAADDGSIDGAMTTARMPEMMPVMMPPRTARDRWTARVVIITTVATAKTETAAKPLTGPHKTRTAVATLGTPA